MALQKPDGTYITVEAVENNTIVLREHANTEHRARYKSGTETEFETTKMRNVQSVECMKEVVKEPTETILNNAKIVAYTELKKLEEFKDCTDV